MVTPRLSVGAQLSENDTGKIKDVVSCRSLMAINYQFNFSVTGIDGTINTCTIELAPYN